MLTHIVKVVPGKIDHDCMVVTLRLMPSKIEKWLGKTEKTVTYKGHNLTWYRYPCYTPASSQLAKFLKSIYRGWEFRHIQYRYRQMIKKTV